ncbi:MAG: polysaccharide biosynthesis C-terminal domain-containing protein, partial [Acutalibacteraceae bacterium]
ISTYLMAPLLIGLILCSKEFVIAVLTEKWLPAVPFMQLLSIYYLIEPIMAFNKQIVIAAGKSALYLKMEIAKKTVGISLLLISVFCFDSVYAIALATVITQIIGLIIQSAPLKRIINYPLAEQIKDVAPSYILAICMAAPIFAIKMLDISYLLKLIIEVIAGALFYLAGSMILKLKPYKYCVGKLAKLKSKIKK